jgi:hypothetical protein
VGEEEEEEEEEEETEEQEVVESLVEKAVFVVNGELTL